jgi:hypothetical protein
MTPEAIKILDLQPINLLPQTIFFNQSSLVTFYCTTNLMSQASTKTLSSANVEHKMYFTQSSTLNFTFVTQPAI